MTLDAYQLLIQNLPVRQQSFTTKRSTWKKAEATFGWLKELNDQLFQQDEVLVLSRQDVLSCTGSIRELVVKTIYWGYPNGMRGHNFINILREDNFSHLEAALSHVKRLENPSTADFERLVSAFGNVQGLGMSTYSKILYFMGIRFHGDSCQILDQRLIDVFKSGAFSEFDALRTVRYNSTSRFYLTYLSIMTEVAERLQTNSENIEQFLFIFGKNLKAPEAESSSHGTIFNDGYCPECDLKGESVDLRLNVDDLWECPICSLQLAVNRVQAVILKSRGIGRINIYPTYGSEHIDGVILTRAKGDTTDSDKTTFNCETELRAYLKDEVEKQLELSYDNLLDTYAKYQHGNPFTHENSPLPYKRQSKYFGIDFESKGILKKLEKRDAKESKDQYKSYKHLHRLLLSLFGNYYNADTSWLPEMGMSAAEVDLCRKHLHLLPEPVTESSSPSYKKERLMALMLDLTEIIYLDKQVEVENFDYIPEASR